MIQPAAASCGFSSILLLLPQGSDCTMLRSYLGFLCQSALFVSDADGLFQSVKCRCTLDVACPAPSALSTLSVRSLRGYTAYLRRHRMALGCLATNTMAPSCCHRRSLRFLYIQSIYTRKHSPVIYRPTAKIPHAPVTSVGAASCGQC